MSNKYPNLIRWADWLDNIYPGQEGNNDESESVQFLLHFCSDEDARIAMMCEPFFKSLDEIAEANNVTVEEIASTLEEMSMKGRVFGHTTVYPGSAIGYHVHTGDSETYYILSGTGRYNDNGRVVTVTAGDVTYTAPGEGHGLECIGEEPVEMIALILYE